MEIDVYRKVLSGEITVNSDENKMTINQTGILYGQAQKTERKVFGTRNRTRDLSVTSQTLYR